MASCASSAASAPSAARSAFPPASPRRGQGRLPDGVPRSGSPPAEPKPRRIKLGGGLHPRSRAVRGGSSDSCWRRRPGACATVALESRHGRLPGRINEQVYEPPPAQYVAIAVFYDAQTLPRLAAHFYRQAVEERNHAMMIVRICSTRTSGSRSRVAAPQTEFADVVEPVRLALEQEKRVTEQISANRLVRRATSSASSSCTGSCRSSARRPSGRPAHGRGAVAGA